PNLLLRPGVDRSVRYRDRLRGRHEELRSPVRTAPSRVHSKRSPGSCTASMSMARLWCDQGKRDQVRELLAPVYGWFTEGSDTPDLKQAKTLIDELAASGCTCRLVCRFLDAGTTTLSTRSFGRRPKSAKARSRGKLGTGWQRVLWGSNVGGGLDYGRDAS